MDAALATVIETVLDEEEQGELAIVHCKVAVPTTKPVTPDAGELGLVMVAVPETKDHVPVPDAGVFPASVAEYILQIF